MLNWWNSCWSSMTRNNWSGKRLTQINRTFDIPIQILLSWPLRKERTFQPKNWAKLTCGRCLTLNEKIVHECKSWVKRLATLYTLPHIWPYFIPCFQKLKITSGMIPGVSRSPGWSMPKARPQSREHPSRWDKRSTHGRCDDDPSKGSMASVLGIGWW